MRVLLVSVDMFSYGGIQRYSRYLLAALRRSPLVTDVRVVSLAARGSTGFAERIEVDVTGRGRNILDKVWFTVRTLWLARARRADIVEVYGNAGWSVPPTLIARAVAGHVTLLDPDTLPAVTEALRPLL